MSLAVIDTVGGSEQLQAQADTAVLLRPLDTFRTQRVGGANHVDQVPATVAALPFAGIGVVEIAVEAVASDLIVEAQGVVAGATGAW
ncbi:hypothetical protein D3C80_1653400 [compost metagenome]